MGRSALRSRRSESSTALRQELERQIESGQCAYCRAHASPGRPLTREHVIPRARGGRRKDVRIIVPACSRCNHSRGCQELVLFLLARPRRISAFLDYLTTLSPQGIQQMDLRVFAELYAAVWILTECAARGATWRDQLRRLASGRTLHRRRHAARRVVGEVGGRLETMRARGVQRGGPSCLLPVEAAVARVPQLGEPLERLGCRLLGVLALVWEVSAEDVQHELERHLRGIVDGLDSPEPDEAEDADADAAVVRLDRWKPRARRRRTRVDARRGRGARRAA